MNRIVLVTQRVDVIVGRHEKRDSLDQRLTAFLRAAGLTPMPVPNDAALAADIFNVIPKASLAGVVLSGGNDLAALGGDAPERDATERELVKLADAHDLPVLGICRGMQFLVHEAGGRLTRIAEHIATRHALTNNGMAPGMHGKIPAEVNSFHQWAVRELPAGWIEYARTADDSIELARNTSGKHLGIMWHPEREAIFSAFDVQRVREHFSADVSR